MKNDFQIENGKIISETIFTHEPKKVLDSAKHIGCDVIEVDDSQLPVKIVILPYSKPKIPAS